MSKTQLIATTPQELAVSQRQLVSLFQEKKKTSEAETYELATAVAEAKNAGLRAPHLQTQLRKAKKQTEYYEKLSRAVASGYYVVPNMPIEVFAVRRDGDGVRSSTSRRSWETFEQLEGQLPAEVGDYWNPVPVKNSYFEREGKPGEEKSVKYYYPVALTDDIRLPGRVDDVRLIPPIKAALSLKTFDDIGIAPQTVGDPMLIGRIRRPGRRPDNGQWASSDYVCFLIAWFVDPERDF